MKKILGIVLVWNEDRFVGQAVRNAWEFCDRILLVDHRSGDATAGILREFAAEPSGKATFHAIAESKRRSRWVSGNASMAVCSASAEKAMDLALRQRLLATSEATAHPPHFFEQILYALCAPAFNRGRPLPAI